MTALALDIILKSLKLPGVRGCYREYAIRGEKENWSYEQYLQQLAQVEIEERSHRRIERNLRQSKLPSEKTLATLETDRFKQGVQRQLPRLCEGDFVERAENILVFGLPGRGKTHLVCAIAHELIRVGYTALFVPTFELVQQLLAAKRDLALSKVLRRLDRFDVIVLDDIGYVKQDRDEMEVLFTFLAERYERKSIMLTSNLVFSQWDQIFKDPMTTAAAVDRLVHHATIIELDCDSFRNAAAQQRLAGTEKGEKT